MSTITEVEEAFADYLRAQLPARTIIESNVGESPAPRRQAVLWSCTGTTYSDYPTTTIEDPLVQRVASTDTVLTFTVVVLGGEAMNDARWLVLGLRQTQRTADLYRVCGLHGVEPVQDLSALETGTIRTRAQFLVTLSALIDITAPAEVIDEVDITIKEPARQFDRTFTVPPEA